MSDDEPPPLEDMTEFLTAKGVEIPVKFKPLPVPEPVKIEEQKKESFAPGIKKGFFNQPAKKPKPVKKTEEIVTVRPKQKQENPLVLKEVQDAMKYTSQNTDEWLNSTLMQRIAEHPFLAAGMKNPRLMEAVNELQKNPSLATTKYKHDQEVQNFFTEFSKIMADHFGRLAESKQKSFEADDEVQEIMKDQDVADVIRKLQAGKQVDFHR